MRLFEQFDNPEMMIVVATAAIFIAKNSKFTEVVRLKCYQIASFTLLQVLCKDLLLLICHKYLCLL